MFQIATFGGANYFMRLIYLGGRYGSVIGNYVMVDDDDFESLNQHKWHMHKTLQFSYAVRTTRKEDGSQTNIKMHRQILGLTDPKIFGDHIDGNGLNCQRYNLRIATCSQNSSNRKQLKHKRYLGVHYSKARRKWIAQVQHKKLHYNSHYFETEDEAALAYNEMALKYHVEFARLNVISPLIEQVAQECDATDL